MWHHPHLFSTLWRGNGEISIIEVFQQFWPGLLVTDTIYGPLRSVLHFHKHCPCQKLFIGVLSTSLEMTLQIFGTVSLFWGAVPFFQCGRGVLNSPGVSPRSKCFRAVLSAKKADFRILVSREIRSFALAQRNHTETLDTQARSEKTKTQNIQQVE